MEVKMDNTFSTIHLSHLTPYSTPHLTLYFLIVTINSHNILYEKDYIIIHPLSYPTARLMR